MCAVGCQAPSERLTFPAAPLSRTADGWFYDVHHRGYPDFALLPDEKGKLDILAYDNGNHCLEYRYRLSNYRDEDVPHLIVLLDSIPFHSVLEHYQAGDFPWFDPPQKVIAPFPAMTEVSFEALFHGPPLPGLLDYHFDREANDTVNLVWSRVWGYQHPFERRYDYELTYADAGISYLDPRPWYAAEMAKIKKAVDENPSKITVAYVVGSSGMLSRYGKPGLEECLAQFQQLCLQLLYERHGAIKISVLSDHGHNLMRSRNMPVQKTLEDAGFHCVEQLHGPNDVVLELNGLVTFASMYTSQPAKVAQTMLRRPEVELGMYMDGERVIVRNASGAAAIDGRRGKLRYTPISADVLDYKSLLDHLAATGKVSPDGFISDEDWFAATVDQQWPDAPRRLWTAFHSEARNTPDVMFSIRDGDCAGAPSLVGFIDMASTHGGLNQVNSAAFVMSMTHGMNSPKRTGEVLQTLEPDLRLVQHK
jgi:hypothetical protein